MTTSIIKPTYLSNKNASNINEEIRKIAKETKVQNIPNAIEQHLESIKNLLQKPQYKESYPNIRPLFESQEGFGALKEVLLFEYNQVLEKAKQENINVSSAMKVLKNIFINNNSEALKIQRNITNTDQSIKLKKRKSEESKAEFKKEVKEELKANPITKLLGFLLKKVINKVVKEIKKKQLSELEKKLNSSNDQFYKITDSFDKELSSLMDAYGKGIKSSTTEVSPYAVSNVTSDRFNQKEDEPIYLPMSRPHYTLLQEANRQQQESEYVAFDPSHTNVQQQNGKKAKKSVTFSDKVKVDKYEEQKTINNDSIYDIPKPQRAQISEIRQKPQIPPKPSKEVIERALSKSNVGISANQQNRPKELKAEYQVMNHSPQHAQVFDLPKPQRAQISEIRQKPQIPPKPSKEVIERALSKSNAGISANQQNRPKELNISTGPKTQSGQKLGSNIQGLIDKIGGKIPVSSPESSPKQSPTSSKKPFTIQNEAPKVQEAKQSIFYSIVNSGIPIPPPMPTQDDLKKVKLIFGKERQVNPKEGTTMERNTIESRGNEKLMEELKHHILKRRKAMGEEDYKPQTKLENPKIEHGKSSPVIGR